MDVEKNFNPIHLTDISVISYILFEATVSGFSQQEYFFFSGKILERKNMFIFS